MGGTLGGPQCPHSVPPPKALHKELSQGREEEQTAIAFPRAESMCQAMLSALHTPAPLTFTATP